MDTAVWLRNVGLVSSLSSSSEFHGFLLSFQVQTLLNGYFTCASHCFEQVLLDLLILLVILVI